MRIPGWLLLLYIVGVVYGSLIPFEVRPHTLPEAWDEFLHIRYLNLDVVSRADWIANIVLYIPLGFLAGRLAAFILSDVTGLRGGLLYSPSWLVRWSRPSLNSCRYFLRPVLSRSTT